MARAPSACSLAVTFAATCVPTAAACASVQPASLNMTESVSPATTSAPSTRRTSAWMASMALRPSAVTMPPSGRQ